MPARPAQTRHAGCAPSAAPRAATPPEVAAANTISRSRSPQPQHRRHRAPRPHRPQATSPRSRIYKLNQKSAPRRPRRCRRVDSRDALKIAKSSKTDRSTPHFQPDPRHCANPARLHTIRRSQPEPAKAAQPARSPRHRLEPSRCRPPTSPSRRFPSRCPNPPPSAEEVLKLYDLPFMDLIHRAQQTHRAHFDPNAIQLSSLLSIKTGGCPEDCAYCPQSAHHDTGRKPTS